MLRWREPYDGLKPAGRDLGPAIPAADAALEKGVPGPLVALLTDAVRDGVRAHFDSAMKRKSFDAHDVPAGREYVEAYVEYIHFRTALPGDKGLGAWPLCRARNAAGTRRLTLLASDAVDLEGRA